MTLNDTGTAVSRGSSWKKWLGIIATTTFVVVFCVVIRYIGGGPEKAAATPPQKIQSPTGGDQTVSNTRQESPASPAPSAASQTASPQTKTSSNKDNAKTPPPEIVADVNGRKITREDLAQQCLAHYGKEILEHMINKQLIIGRVPAAEHHGYPRGNRRRDRAHGDPIRHSGRSMVEIAQAGAGHHSRPVCRRHHLAHAGLASTGRREIAGQQGRIGSANLKFNTARRSRPG